MISWHLSNFPIEDMEKLLELHRKEPCEIRLRYTSRIPAGLDSLENPSFQGPDVVPLHTYHALNNVRNKVFDITCLSYLLQISFQLCDVTRDLQLDNHHNLLTSCIRQIEIGSYC